MAKKINSALSVGANYRDYAAYLLKFFRPTAEVFAVVDASDGSAGPVLKVLGGKKLKLKILNGTPDGDFPAHGPNPMKADSEKELSREVKKLKADFGAIFDGDGDRIFFVDDLGRRVSPDKAAFIISKNFKPPFVATPTTGWGFKKALGVRDVVYSPVGHYFIKRKMRAVRAKFSAEPSGHYYFEFIFGSRRTCYDSALAALVEFASEISILKKNGQKLSEWLDSLPQYYSSGELNFKVKDIAKALTEIKRAYSKSGKISELDGISCESENFWFNARPSNTEPLLRFNAEAKTKKELAVLLGEIKKIIKK